MLGWCVLLTVLVLGVCWVWSAVLSVRVLSMCCCGPRVPLLMRWAVLAGSGIDVCVCVCVCGVSSRARPKPTLTLDSATTHYHDIARLGGRRHQRLPVLIAVSPHTSPLCSQHSEAETAAQHHATDTRSEQ